MKTTKVQNTIVILLVLVIVILLNLIVNTRFFRVDLTSGKTFTLSKASKTVVANLEEPLTIKVFASENLSPQLNDVKRYMIDLLADYRSYGKGRFYFEVINPGNDEELEKEAQDYKVGPFQENVWEKDKLELKVVYLGLVVLYGDKQEPIPQVQSTVGLEYNLTSLIKRITSQQEMKVGFLTGHGEPSPFENMQNAKNILETNYKLTTVDLNAEDNVPEDVNALLIVQPTTEITDAEKLKIDQFVMQGGSVGWFFNKVAADLQQGTATPIAQMKIDDFTSNYGFRVNSDLIADMKSSMINIQQRRGIFIQQNTINYPFFPVVENFNKKHEVSADLEIMSLFFPSSVDTTLGVDLGLKVTPLFYSGSQSMLETGRLNINATRKFNKAEFDRAHLPYSLAVEGSFKSYFADKDMPLNEEGDPVELKDPLLLKSPENSRMLVVADGNFLRDEYMSNAANIYMLLNGVDWLVGDTELIKLRNREVVMRPLREISDAAKSIYKYINWFLPPGLAIIFGIVYWQVRRNNRKREG